MFRKNLHPALAPSLSFHISVKVSMEQFAGWKPERITAFFGGIAQMLAAKDAVEKGDAIVK